MNQWFYAAMFYDDDNRQNVVNGIYKCNGTAIDVIESLIEALKVKHAPYEPVVISFSKIG